MRRAAELVGLPAIKDIGTYCYALMFAWNLQMLLHWEDRNSMAHSIEARVPFTDHRLVEFSLLLGNDHKIRNADTKRVLRRAMNGVLAAVIQRPNFCPGDRIRVLNGAFIDCLGLYEGLKSSQRVAILLDLLGRKVRVMVDVDSVVAA